MDNHQDQPIAIVGMAFRLPGDLSTPDALWNALISDKNLITEIDNARFSTKKYWHPRKSELGKSYTFKAGVLSKIDEFDAGFFGISPREAFQMDPQQRLLLELTWEALENGNQNPEQLAGSNCAVYVGIANNEHMIKCNLDLPIGDSYTMLGNCPSIAANRISYVFDLHGPSLSIDTACSSSMVALHQACSSIREGEASSAIVGGINFLMSPIPFVGFSKAMMLSPDGACKSFDADANGYVRSEGCVVFYLKPLREAKKNGDPIHGVILNSAVNSDGRTNGIALPSAAAQAALISHVHKQIGLSANDISYVEAHGTGTPVGDPIEAAAIGNAIGQHRSVDNPLLIGSVKSNIGHLEVVSGLVGIVKSLLCFKYKKIPATLHFNNPNPHIDFKNLNLSVVDRALDLPKQKKRATIAVNSFGFGGTNAHVVLSEYEAPIAQPQPHLVPPLLLSVRNELAFQTVASTYHVLLTKNPDRYYDIAYTLARRRSLHDHSIIIDGDTVDSITEQLEKIKNDDVRSSRVVTGKNFGKHLSVALVYSGNGSQWQGMGQQLMQESWFEKTITEIDLLFSKYSDFSIKTALMTGLENSLYHLTEVAQPCLFALQVAITQYLLSQGIVVEAVLGHSVGEVTAAWMSGALTLAQAVEVIYVRSFWQGKTRGTGKMAAIALPLTTVQTMLSDLNLSEVLTISAINSPKGITLSGELSALEKLKSVCAEKNIFYSILELDYAFHSKYMDSIEVNVLSALSNLKPNNGAIRYVSTVNGKTVSGNTLTAAYWWRNIREPVNFQNAVDELITDGIKLFIEVGPHSVLKRYVDDCLANKEIKGLVVSTMKRNAGALQDIRSAVFKMGMAGATLNWHYFFPVIGNHIELPAYPWIKEKYWIKPTNENTDQTALSIEHPLLGYRIKQGEPTWENHLDAVVVSYLADHVVSGLPVMPAAGYAEMALAAAKIWYESQNREVCDLEILSPILFDHTVCRVVRFSLQPDDGIFQIKSRPRHSDETWSLNAVGRIADEPAYTPKRKIKIVFRELKNTAKNILDKEKFYAQAEQFGLSYGQTFQSIEKCWTQQSLALATVKLHSDLIPTLKYHTLHPVLLDACFQLLIGYENKKHDMLLPVRVGRLKITGKFYGALQITAQIIKRNKLSVLANFSIINGDNVVVAEITDCRFKSAQLDKQTTASKRYICKPHLLAENQYTNATDTVCSIRDAAEKIISTTVDKSSDHFQIMMPLFDLMIGQFAYATVKALAREKTDFSFTELCAFAKIATTQQHLLKLCLNILIEDHYLQSTENDRFSFISDQKEIEDPIATWHALLRDYPHYLPELVMIGRCGLHLKDILSGKIKPKKIFPVTDKNIATLTHGYDMMLCAVTSHLKKWPFLQRRLRILEIADVPGLFIHLLNSLPSNNVDYYVATLNEQTLLKIKNNVEHEANIRLIQLNKILLENSVVWIEENNVDRMQTWVSAVTHAGTAEKMISPKRCEQLLQQSGYTVSEPLCEPSAGDCEGIYIVLAQPLSVQKVEETAPVNEDYQWLLIINDAKAIAPLLTALQEKQSNVSVVTYDSFNTLLSSYAEKQEKLRIVFLAGTKNDEKTPLFSVENECAVIINLVKSIQTVTWSIYPQLTLVTQGGALCDSSDIYNIGLNHAALWGFRRVLVNEYPELHCQLIDLPENKLAKVRDRFIHTLLNPDSENEIMNTADAIYGLRVTEIPSTPTLKKQHGDFRLDFLRPGPLKNLQWFPVEKSLLADDEVAVKPLASGLNFRDVMYSMGLIPDEAVEDGFLGQTVGMEFAGEIIATGKSVSDFSVGDKVMGFAPASFSSYAITKSYAVTPLPNAWSYSAGASIPIAFFTAYYALTHLARIQPGERLLIHGAAGGVGIAAIQLAQYLGVTIYATAGSDEKRDFLRLLGIKHIYNSRDLAFADQIMEQTQGEGIDVVLNCLAGEAIYSNLMIMKPFGRFLELGKRDFYANSRIGLRPFRNNISYFGIDADQLIVKNPALSQKLFKEMFLLFDQGVLSPLPYRAFSADEIHDAFRYMQQSRHIGKIIIDFSEPPTMNFATIKNDKKFILKSDATYLVTGGLNGFGFRTAQWLVEKGARHLVLLGRRGVGSDAIQLSIEDLIKI